MSYFWIAVVIAFASVSLGVVFSYIFRKIRINRAVASAGRSVRVALERWTSATADHTEAIDSHIERATRRALDHEMGLAELERERAELDLRPADAEILRQAIDEARRALESER